MARTQVQSELIATNAISGTIIADNAITATHIATNAISGTLVQSSGITTDMIASNNVTAAKIVSDGIETRHLHSNVISGQSSVTAASGDYVLIGDTSDSNNLKKALVSDLGNDLDAAVTINESGAAVDFRVEGDNEANLLFVDGSADKIGIGTSSPNSNLHVGSSNATGDSSNPAFQIGGTTTYRLGFYTDAEGGIIQNLNGDNGLQFRVKTAGEVLRIIPSGNVGIGDTAPQDYLEINGSGSGLGGLTISNSTHNHAALSFARSSTATARIYITEPDATHTSSMHFQTSDASGSSPNLVTAMTIDEGQNVGIGVTAPTETFVVSGDTNITGQMYLGPNSNDRRPFAKPSNWGYSSGYKAIVLGSASATYNTSISGAVTLSFNYDPSGNSNGSFSGNGNEILFRNGTQFVTPNSADDAFNLKNLVLKDGYVGIGTATPARELDIQATSGWAELALRGASGSGGSLEFWTTSTKRAEIFADTEDIVFRNTASNTERMRINSTGQVLIGRASALQSDNMVTIEGSGTGAGNSMMDIRNTSSSDTCGCIALSKATTTTTSANRFIWFFTNNFSTSMGAIGGNGASNVQFVTASDERLKENIKPITGALDKVLALNPVSYTWKENGEDIKAGFVAQEVEKVLPEYTDTEEDEMKTKSLTGGMTAGYIAVLTKAIQEQQEQIETLKAEIEELKESE